MPRPRAPKLVRTAPLQIKSAEPIERLSSTARKQHERPLPRPSGRRDLSVGRREGSMTQERQSSRISPELQRQAVASGARGRPWSSSKTNLTSPLGKVVATSSRTVRSGDQVAISAFHGTERASLQRPQQSGEIQVEASGDSHAASRHRQNYRRTAASSREVSRRPSLAPRLQGTPQAQSSITGAIQFKRRARQPSLLQLAQAQHDASLELDDEDLYDFRPDDESTPLVKSLSLSNHENSSSSHPTSSSRKRKLASPEIQVPASQSQRDLQPILPEQEESFVLPPASDEGTVPEPTLPRLRQARTPSPQIYSDTLAPPQSSCSPIKPPPQAARRKQSKPKPKPKATSKSISPSRGADPESPVLSPQSTVTSAQPSPSHKAIPLQPLTTARLQNLLPRRRTRQNAQNTYDIPSSSDVELDTTHLGEDEDELSYYRTSKVKRKKPGRATSKRGAAKTSKDMNLPTSKTNRVSKTYARRSIVESHSENDDDGSVDEDTNQDEPDRPRAAPVLDAKAKTEMERLANKFREVDEYTLDFEDMTGSSSQMKDAR